MDAKTMLLYLQDQSKLKSSSTQDWNQLIEQYPYFGAAQMLKYAHDSLNDAADIYKTALYKQDPLLFVQWVTTVSNLKINSDQSIIEMLENEEIHVEKEISTIEVKTETKTEKDILELINELPNSNPISKSSFKPLEKEVPIDKVEEAIQTIKPESESKESQDQSLMVMMSFTDWLNYFKDKQIKEHDEELSKKALKSSWQKEKLTAVMEEDIDEIPEPLFQQAMDSITMESSMVSESLAKILASQGKIDKAIDMYKKLSLSIPEKRTYFADLIEKLNLKRD